MKRIIIALMLIVLFGMTVASAEITRGKDTFTGAIIINSGVHEKTSELKALYFRKIPQLKNVDYQIEAVRINFKEFIFSDTFMEIKIDDSPIQELPVKEAKKMSLVRESDIYSSITILLPDDIIPQINTAKRIALKFQTAAGPYVYVLPDSVLAEWKQVIATEK